jgi:hypothetical protein
VGSRFHDSLASEILLLKREMRSFPFSKYECMKKPSQAWAISRGLGLTMTSILLALTLDVCATFTQLHAFPATPPRVRFTGVLVPVNEQTRKGLLEDLNVVIARERATLLVDKMQTIGGVGLNRIILQRLFPPLVHVIGPEDLILRLKSAESADKILTIEGLLYTASRTFFVIRVDESEP